MLLQDGKGRIYLKQARYTKKAIHNKRLLSDEHRQTIYELDAGNTLLRMNRDREVILYV